MVAPGWSEGFENGGAIPACWSQGVTNPEDWLFATSAGHVGYEGIITGSTVTNNYFAYVDDSGPDGIGTTLESPWIDVSALTAPMIEFYLISDNEGYSNVDFSVYVYDGAGWNPMLTSNSNTINGGWEYKYILLDGLTITGDIKIRFIVAEFVVDNITDDVAIDDVSVVETPACPSPINPFTNNITPVSADLNWTAGTTETNWDIEWGVAGFTLGSGTMVNDLTSPSHSFSGLTKKTTYDWYIRADCGGNDIDVSSWIGPITFQTIADPVSGAYTINSGLPSGGTNFNNFTDFASEINLGGLAGPVTVEVVAASGPYNEQVILGEITNSSATNTISINGNGEKLEYLSTTTDQRATLKLDGTDYFTLDNLVIEALGSADGEYGFSTHLINEADYNTFTNCEFIATMTSSSAIFAGFVTSSSHSSATSSGLAASNLTVQNCTTSGGYYGMVINGPTEAPNAQNNTITGNAIKDFYTIGLYLSGQNNSIFSENEISRPNRTAVGGGQMIYLVNDFSGTEITKNRIFDFAPNASTTSAGYAIRSGSLSANIGEELLIANNVVSGWQGMNGHCYGFYLSTLTDFGNLKIYHNTISIDNETHPGGVSYRSWAFVQTGSNPILDVRNNIFSITANTGGADVCIYFGTNDATVTCDNNDLHAEGPGTNSAGRWDGVYYESLAEWQTANGGIFDQNSVDDNPQFLNPSVGDFTPTYFTLDNIGADLLTSVPDDILGTARTATPDPGAYEFDAPTCILPAQLPIVGVSATTATLAWFDNNTPAATMWDIELVETGVAPTGTPTVSVTENPYEFTGLTAETTYDWYVRTNCGGGDYSYWSGPETFTTSFTAIDVFPYLEDFETFVTGADATGYMNNWTTSPTGTTGDLRWNVDAGGTPSGSTGPAVDHTTGTAAGIYLFTEASQGATGDEAYIYSPPFDLTSLPAATIGFWYHMYGSGMGELHLDISTNGGGTWVSIMTPLIGAQQASSADPWLKASVSLDSYAGQIVQFRFTGIKGSGYQSDMAIDDFSIYSGYMISGNIAYANTAMTALDTCTVELFNAADTTLVGTTTTDTLGYYEFPALLDGDYTIVTSTTKTWGGFTTADNLLVKRYLLSLLSLTDLKKRAADVNASNTITSADQLTIGRRLLSLLTSWPAPDFVFDGMFGVPPVNSGYPVNVSGSDVVQDIESLCSGDVNGSFVPVD